MKILAVSDQVDDSLYSPNVVKRFGNVDLVVGCGDLPYAYLEFMVTVLGVPLFYVPGNHDPLYKSEKASCSAEGCENLDGQIMDFNGLTLAGLGGSIRYKPSGFNQYTQAEMAQRVRKLAFLLWGKRLFSKQPLDIFVAHSPPAGIHDDVDRAHNGFKAFNWVIKYLKPQLFLHGHTMFYKTNLESPIAQVGGTRVVNVYPYRLIEL
jgi:uncharacterized protein